MDWVLLVEGPRWAPDTFRVELLESSDGKTVPLPRGAVFVVNLSRLLGG